MIKQKQLFKHAPEQGIYGDCARTVLACLLDLSPEEVPHAQYEQHGSEQFDMHEAWLIEQGFRRITVPFVGQGTTVENVLERGMYASSGMPYILAGKSKNGTDHVVICQEDQIIWDPAIDDSGIVGCDSDGYYWLTWLVRPIGVPT